MKIKHLPQHLQQLALKEAELQGIKNVTIEDCLEAAFILEDSTQGKSFWRNINSGNFNNEHIKPGQLVPAELRLEIYKEAKRSIEAGDTLAKYFVKACLNYLLEYILYKTLSNQIYKKYYKQMFPEFKSNIDFELNKQHAIDELTKAIEALEKVTEKPKVVVVGVGQESILYNISNRINDNLNELSFDAALDVYNQIRERMRERLAEEMNEHEERINYLKSIEL